MKKFKFNNPVAEISAAKSEKPEKDGILAKIAVFKENPVKTDLKPANNKPEPSYAASIISGIKQLDAEIKSNNDFCIQLINQLLKERSTLESIRSIIALDASNPAAKYAVGIQSLLNEFNAGELFQLVKRCDAIAKENEQLGRNFLTDKIKPLICDMNVLIQLESNDYRWATYEELKEQLPVTQKPETNQLMKLPVLKKLRTMQQQHRISKAKKDTYCSVKKDGSIIYHPRPFTGEMSEADKKLLRQKAQAEAEAKIRADIEKITYRKLTSEAMAAEKALQERELEIHAKARLKAAEIHAKSLVSRTKLATYKPIAVAASIAAIAVFIAIKTDSVAPQDQEIQTASIEQNWELEE